MSGQSFTLGSSISSTQTTISLTSFTVPVTGTNITMATMGTSIAYGTLAPGTSSSELISFTGVTQNSDGTATLTGVTRGLDKEYPYTEVTGFKQPHAGQTIFILSDAPQVFNEMGALKNDNTWTGRQQFPTAGTASAAVIGTTYVAPTQSIEVASKGYVDAVAIAGAPNATTSVQGLVQLPTQAQVEAGTQIGSTGAQLALPNMEYGARKVIGYAVDTGSANAYAISLTPTPTAYATGQIIGFQASFTNTGNATVNVSSLGAKNLFLGSTGLFAGVIATNAYVGATYDGTQFKITNSSSLLSYTNTANTVALRDNSGNIEVGTPADVNDATSKTYVDTAISTFIASGAPGTTVSNTTTNVATIAIVGGILSTNKGIRIRLLTSTLNTTANATFTGIVAYGGTTIASFGYGGVSGTPTFLSIHTVDILLLGAGTTGTQKALNMITQTGTTFDAVATAQTNSSSIDSTISQNITVSLTTNSVAATSTFVGYFVQKAI